MKRMLEWLALVLLSACSGPTFQYAEVIPNVNTPDPPGPNVSTPDPPVPNDNTPDPPGSLRFSLQKLSVLVDKPTSTSKSNDTSDKPTSTSKSNDTSSPATNSTTVVDGCKGFKPTDQTFNKCLTGVKPVASSVPDNQNGSFIATPNNSFLQKALGATGITGSTVSGTNFLFKQVSINYASNVKNIITSAGAGATTGFALGGPLGLGVGAVAGSVEAVALAPGAPPPPPPLPPAPPPPRSPLDITAQVCDNERADVQWAQLATVKQIELGLPVTLDFDFSSLPDFPATKESQQKLPSSCWHPVPNKLLGSGAAPPLKDFANVDTSVKGRLPAPGDGWFYRIYFPQDETKLPGVDATTFKAEDRIQRKFIPNMPNDQFPFSYCRPNAYLQITWWKEIAQGSKAVSYSLGSIPDPNYFQVVNVPYSGNINFNSVCGATASSGNGPDYTGYWDALTQEINTVQSAVQKANSASGK
jgi:hypothetical protein